jgi:hypothetical protein
MNDHHFSCITKLKNKTLTPAPLGISLKGGFVVGYYGLALGISPKCCFKVDLPPAALGIIPKWAAAHSAVPLPACRLIARGGGGGGGMGKWR